MPSRKLRPAAPVALTIAGSDNSCGAGIQADLKTFGAFGVYGLTAVTCVVSEIPGKVEMVHAVTPALLRSQIRILFEAYPIAAVKTGMLYSRALLRVVSEELADRLGMFHLVVDPVMVASSGDPLLKGGHLRGRDAVDVLYGPRGCEEFTLRRLSGRETHGSGCTLSAALAAGLARGRSLPAAVEGAKKFLHRAIARQLAWRRGKVCTRALRHQ